MPEISGSGTTLKLVMGLEMDKIGADLMGKEIMRWCDPGGNWPLKQVTTAVNIHG